MTSTPDLNDPAIQEQIRRSVQETDEQLAAFRATLAADRRNYDSWKVTVPTYDAEGVVIEHFEVTPEESATSMFRAAFNPQRGDRSILPGTYTRLMVDGIVWMSDTPAEIRDHDDVDEAMKFLCFSDSSMLIVGLGLGMVLQRAIKHHRVPRIDVVEKDPRVVSAVEDHYWLMAKAHEVDLTFHTGDIHELPLRGLSWDLAYFDIWPDINHDDVAEVHQLRKRFWRRTGKFLAWAQAERVAQGKRVRNHTGWY